MNKRDEIRERLSRSYAALDATDKRFFESRHMLSDVTYLLSQLDKAEALLQFSIKRFKEMGYQPQTPEEYFAQQGETK